MGSSLEIFDRQGRNIFNSSSSPIRVIGEFTTGTNDGGITDDRLYEGKVFVFPIKFSPNFEDEDDDNRYYYTAGALPRLSIYGNRISWSFPDIKRTYIPGKNSVTFRYGVYAK